MMKNTILKILKELTAINSLSDTKEELKATEYLYQYVQKEEYFKDHPEYAGRFPLPEDYLGREAVYALVKGNSDKTIVFMGHVDVVTADDYGKLKEYAFDIDAIADQLKDIELYEDARTDLESGEWIFGRGVADMKGGIAVVLAYLLEYAKRDCKIGNLLFLAVPDEESYSAGMRGVTKLLATLKETYHLNYDLLIDPEPNFRTQNKQIMSIGSVGKCMPTILVQGATAHICKWFDGLNPLGVMSEIFLKTELSLEFCDRYEQEITAPPTWLWLKDMKQEYDVSVPLRVSGYINMLSFETTPDEILNKLSKIAKEAFHQYIQKINSVYQIYSKFTSSPIDRNADFQPKVMTIRELTDMLQKEKGDEFVKFQQKLYHNISQKIRNGELNYPQATIYMMGEMLTYSGILSPIILLGFAPPYYLPVHSDKLPGKEGAGSYYYNMIKSCAKEKLQLDFEKENYMLGISDLSYIGIDKYFDYDSYSKNTPAWGELYQIDFNALKEINIPGIILGPWGKDLHQMTERVNRKSLTEEFPTLLEAVVNGCFDRNDYDA